MRSPMPLIDADGCPIHVEVEGRDDAPALMLSNSLGTNLHMWDDQVKPFTQSFRLVRYDRRGHGKSGAPKGIQKLILSNTSSYFADKALWNDRIRTVREKGLAGTVGANMERWFTKDFRERAPEKIARMTEMFLATPLEGYVGCGEAVRD